MALAVSLLVVGVGGAALWRISTAPDEPDGVRTFDHGVARHVAGSVDYTEAPPTGGDHAPEWLECGVYDRPVPDELAVHALEHGAIWITYRPGLGPAQLDMLERALPDEGVLSPYDEQSADIVVTAWNRQLALTSASDPRLGEFVKALGGGRTAPEPFASCAGGVTTW